MLSLEQENIICEQLHKENAPEFVRTIILRYSNTTQHMSELLELIPKIAENGIKERQKIINDYAFGLDLLIGERYMYPIQKRKSKSKKQYNPDFPVLLYVAKAHFPNGNTNGCSIADKAFFNEFIETIREKIGFDYENKEDWKWIKNTAKCEEWFLKVIRQNIDENFRLEEL